MNLTKGQITDYALKELQYRGCNVWRNNNVRAVPGRTFTGKKGVPDIAGYHRRTGIAVYCEIKTVNDRLSVEQALFLDELKQAGGLALIARDGEFGAEIIQYDGVSPEETIASLIEKLNQRA